MAHAAYTTSRAHLALIAATAATVLSAIWAKEMNASNADVPTFARVAETAPEVSNTITQDAEAERSEGSGYPENTRWFDGRPIRPARTVWITTTGYSPDAQSCGEFADGMTATLHSVRTNGGHLVAADTSIYAFGTMFSIPGYAYDDVVPVLDVGGAIKGERLDLLFPTHEEALEWGVRRLQVVIWEYADGEPAPNVREVR